MQKTCQYNKNSCGLSNFFCSLPVTHTMSLESRPSTYYMYPPLPPDCSISCLHYSDLQLYIGLTCGKVLILDAITFDCLCQLSCHRDHVRSLVTIDLSQLQDSEFFSPYKRDSSMTCSSFTPSVSHSSPSPVQLSEGVHRSPSLNSVQSQTGYQLLSFGTGFQSYFDGPESKQYLKSGFLLVWEAEQSKTTL